MRLGWLVPALVLPAMASGCTGDSDDDSGAQLTFEFADGTTYVIEDAPTVTCDKTSRDGLDRMNVSIQVDEAGTPSRYAWLTFPTSAVADQERTWELPYSGHDEATEMLMFISLEGVSSTAEASDGTVTISHARCGEHPELEASFDATLGSQTTGSGGVTVTGEIDEVRLAPDDGGTIIIK